MTAALWRWSRRLGVVGLAVVIASRLLQNTRRPGRPFVTRCPIHGVAYDGELEMCPECAKS